MVGFQPLLLLFYQRVYLYPQRKNGPENSSNRRGLPKKLDLRSKRRDPPASSRRLWDDWHSHVPGEQCGVVVGERWPCLQGKKKLRRLNIPRPSIYKWMVSNWMLPNHYIKNGCFNKHPLINGCLGFQAGVKTPEIDNPQHQCI